MTLLILLGAISAASVALSVVLLYAEDRRHAAELERARLVAESWKRSYCEAIDALQAAHAVARRDERRLRRLAENPSLPVGAYMSPTAFWHDGHDALADLREGVDLDLRSEEARRAHAQ